jgi:hypothetical protein
MSQDSAFDDASIPVLTEIVRETSPQAEAVPPVETEAGRSLEERAAAQLSDDEWATLELRLTERILQQLQGRVEFVLQQRLRDSMADVLQHALSGLTDEIRSGLEQTIEQIVSRAVAQELGHLKTLRH